MAKANTAFDRWDALAWNVAAGEPAAEVEVENPATGQVLATVPTTPVEELAIVLERARAAQAEWQKVPVRRRAAVLLRFHDLLLTRQAEILDIIQLENGKARLHAFEEVLDALFVARYYGRSAGRHLRSRRRRGAIPLLTHVVEHRRPKGVVGVISPWNYPFTLAVSDALPALVAGNAVVLKPDMQTPYSALWTAEVLSDAGLPPDVFSVIVGTGDALGPRLVDEVDSVMFTGSTRTGRIVAEQAASRLIDASMELGGKNALLVLADADVAKAAKGTVRACFSSAGQLCVSAERIYVHRTIARSFIDALVDEIGRVRVGCALDFTYDMGTLASAHQLAVVQAHVKDAMSKGAEVVMGGHALPSIGPYVFAPTVLTNVRDEMMLFAEETFGPVASIQVVDTDDDAIALANNSDYGLSFSVWTKSGRRGRAVARLLQAGTVNVNEAYAAAWGSMDAPMGGVKQSGLGRRHGAEGLLKFTSSQTVATQRLVPIAPYRDMSNQTFVDVMNRAARLLRKVPGKK